MPPARGGTGPLAVLNTCLLAIIVGQLGGTLYYLKGPSDQANKLAVALADMEREADKLKDATPQRGPVDPGSDAASLVPYGFQPGQIVSHGGTKYRIVRATGSGESARIVGVRISDGQPFGLRPNLCKLAGGENR